MQCRNTSPLFEITRVFVRLDDGAGLIVNADHSATGIFGSKVKLLYFV